MHNLVLHITNTYVRPPTTLIDSRFDREARLDRRQSFQVHDRQFGPFTDSSALLNQINWAPVDLPGGSYIVRATADELSLASTSSPFTIYNGTDLSCLGAVTSSTTPTSGSSTSIPFSSSPISSTSSPANSTTAAVPIGAATTDDSKRVAGAIAGGVVGGFVLVVVIIGFSFFLRLSSRRRNARANGAGGGGNSASGRGRGALGMGKWNGLSSRDSNIGGASLPTVVGDIKTDKRMKHATVDSMGAMSVGSNALSPIGSDEDLSTLAEEKSGKEYIETVPPLAYRQSSSSSAPNTPQSAYNPQNPFSSQPPYSVYPAHPAYPPTSPTSPTSATSTTSRKSTSQNRALALAKLDSHSSHSSHGNGHGIERQTSVSSTTSTTSNFNRRQSLDGRVLSSTGMIDPFATPVGAEMIPMNRSSSSNTNGGNSNGRRAVRKPVPTYDSLQDEGQGSPASPSSPLSSSYVPSPISREVSTSGSVGSRRPGFERQESSSSSPVTSYPLSTSGPYTHTHNPSTPYTRKNDSGSSSALGIPSSLRQGSLGGGGAISREDLLAAGLGAGIPDLNHKSSFGDGRMVHYLIPDMPPPPKE